MLAILMRAALFRCAPRKKWSSDSEARKLLVRALMRTWKSRELWQNMVFGAALNLKFP
jgi:hypothetical protein